MTGIEIKSAVDAPPLVSVSITSYNSAKWLARALDSALAQRTSFPIEIIIGDDCSQDATVQIAHSYKDRYPDVIRVLERSKNVGIQRNYYETFEQCRGKYIAWLDADDYWTDPEKLTIQVAMMEADPTINLCSHLVRRVTIDGTIQQERSPSLPPGRYGLEEILRHNFTPTPSVVFRNGIQRDIPEWYFDLAPIPDWPIYVLAALSGDIVLLDRAMADYTLTPGSSFSSKGVLFSHSMDAKFYGHIESILPFKWHRLIRSEKAKRYEGMAYALREQGDFTESRKAAMKAFTSPHLTDNMGSKTKALVAACVREAQWRWRSQATKRG